MNNTALLYKSPIEPPSKLLLTADASTSPSLLIDDKIDETYNEYLIKLSNIVAEADNADFKLRSSSNGGISFDTGASDYRWVRSHIDEGAGAPNVYGGATNAIQITSNSSYNLSNTAGEAFSGEILMSSPLDATSKTLFEIRLWYNRHGGGITHARGIAERNAIGIVNALQFTMNIQTIVSGRISLHGIKTA